MPAAGPADRPPRGRELAVGPRARGPRPGRRHRLLEQAQLELHPQDATDRVIDPALEDVPAGQPVADGGLEPLAVDGTITMSIAGGDRGRDRSVVVAARSGRRRPSPTRRSR